MANIRMNQNSFGNYSFQRSKVSPLPSPHGLNGTNKELASRKAPIKYWRNNSLKASDSEKSKKSKLPFSEKLKNLLENGGQVENFDKEDPYTFQDVELSSLTNAVNGFSENLGNYGISNLTVRTIADPVAQRIKVPSEPQVSSTKNFPTAVTSYSLSQSSTLVLSPTAYRQSDILPRHPSEAAKVKSPLLKPLVSPHSSGNSRFYSTHIEKVGKTLKGFVSPNNGRPAGCGKPLNFGKSQMSKLAIAKIEKSMESRNKNCSKGKPLHSLQKTASISRLLSKTKRPVPTRSASLDSDTLSSKGKLSARKSLLEESLLGIKPNEWTANRPIRGISSASSPPIVQTATTTVQVPSRPRARPANHSALQRTWALRNKIKLLKRDYQSFGLLLDDSPEQDIDSCEGRTFQNYWFSLCNDYNSFSGHNRNAKLAQLKTELRHKLKQQQWNFRDDYQNEMARILIHAARHKPNVTAFLIPLETANRSKSKLDRWRGQVDERGECGFVDNGSQCQRSALPCVGFCEAHLTNNQNQLLFTPCSAHVPPDNRTCEAPAIGRSMDQVFCAYHQRLQFNSQKPKKVATEKTDVKIATQGKRNRSSLSSTRTGRSRKRKRHSVKDKKELMDSGSVVKGSDSNFVPGGVCTNTECLSTNTQVVSKSDIDESQDVEVGEDLPLDSAELASLATQATRLLEEHDLTNVLNHIPADAFNDLFTGDKEEYEPTPQETEELERALEAVDNDVKTLEKETQGILDMLDEQTIAQTLAALPEVVPVLYQNGFGGLGPLEQTLCSLHPDAINTLPIPPQADVLQS